MANRSTGLIRADEAYSKAEVLARLNISQKFWDKMLGDGLPYARVGKSKWVTGQDLLNYLRSTSSTKAIDSAVEEQPLN